MSDVEIVHPVPADEIRNWLVNVATTFLDDPEAENFDRFVEAFEREWDSVRSWGARAHGRWVGTLATEPHRLTVPGPQGGTADIAIDGLTVVTVNATHRRRGLLTQMLDESLREAVDRGECISALIAAEWPIYGRFGYAPATPVRRTPTSRAARRQPRPDRGRCDRSRRANSASSPPASSNVPAGIEPGQIDRDGEWWPRRLALQGYRPFKHGKAPHYYLHESADGPDGLLVWAPERDFDIDGKLGSITVRGSRRGQRRRLPQPVELPRRHRHHRRGRAAHASGR